MKKILVFLLAIGFLMTAFSDDKTKPDDKSKDKATDEKGLTKISAKDDKGTKIGTKVPEGTKITIQYVKGVWWAGHGGWWNLPGGSQSPDNVDTHKLNKILLYATGKKNSSIEIAELPADTESKPYEVITAEAYDSLCLRINDTFKDGPHTIKDNGGTVFYKVTIEPPAKDAKDEKK